MCIACLRFVNLASKSLYIVSCLAFWFSTGSGVQCSNKTAYIYPDQTTAVVEIDDDDTANLPAGEYKFRRSFDSYICFYRVPILSKCPST